MGLVEEGSLYEGAGMGEMPVVEAKEGKGTEEVTTQKDRDGGAMMTKARNTGGGVGGGIGGIPLLNMSRAVEEMSQVEYGVSEVELRKR